VFSRRVPASFETNALSRALRDARAAGSTIQDLTLSNPTKAGFTYPAALLAPLAAPAALTYEPASLGLPAAREAVAHDYARRGLHVPADRIVLTSSTSEAYSLLFKVLCAASGDAVLTPAPSYPLFEHLTRLDGVAPVPYALEYHGRWVVDTRSVEAAWSDATRAVLAVSPNNPTGSVLGAEDWRVLESLCGGRGAALIVDEVFADYPLREGAGYAGATRHGAATCLTFRLGGLSKSAGLPQVKVGWIAVDGPADRVTSALERLEFVCDAYLSVSTPAQLALPALIEAGAGIREQIRARIQRNYRILEESVARYPAIDVLQADAGWSAVVRVPSRRSEEGIVLELLERDRILVHPGFFFDFPHEAILVLSLLPPEPEFADALSRLLERVA
jgi:aspartate/methionine/tyrosine aminotransferase